MNIIEDVMRQYELEAYAIEVKLADRANNLRSLLRLKVIDFLNALKTNPVNIDEKSDAYRIARSRAERAVDKILTYTLVSEEDAKAYAGSEFYNIAHMVAISEELSGLPLSALIDRAGRVIEGMEKEIYLFFEFMRNRLRMEAIHVYQRAVTSLYRKLAENLHWTKNATQTELMRRCSDAIVFVSPLATANLANFRYTLKLALRLAQTIMEGDYEHKGDLQQDLQ